MLVRSFVLSKKKGKEVWIEPLFKNGKTRYIVHHEGKPTIESTVNRKGAICACCGAPVEYPYIRQESREGRMSAQLMAVVAEGSRGRLYISPDEEQDFTSIVDIPENYPTGNLAPHFTGGSCVTYGLNEFHRLFTNRQLTALTAFSELVGEAQKQAEADALASGLPNDYIALSEGGTGARAYGEAVGVYLAFVIDKMTDYHSSICSWHSSKELIRNTFGRQAIPMVWDYAEANPFSSSAGCFDNMLEWVFKSTSLFPATANGDARQFDAQSDCGLRNIMVSTDPPYYDNIAYADLSDFFYIWMRQALKQTYPNLFRTMLVNKYAAYLREQERSTATIQKYVHDLTALSTFLAGRAMTKGLLLEWKENLIGQYTPASVNNKLAAVNGFLSFCGLGALRLRKLKIQKALFLSEDKELTRAEYVRLVRAAERAENERLALVIQTICATGIRVSELRFITAEAVQAGRTEVNNKGKRRTVFLPDKLRRMLKSYLQKQKITAGAVFLSKNGRPLDRSNIWRDMKSLCESAGVEPSKVFPHNLRHLFARTYYALERDLSRLADILGHTNVTTTRIYTAESGAVHARQIGRLGLVVT